MDKIGKVFEFNRERRKEIVEFLKGQGMKSDYPYEPAYSLIYPIDSSQEFYGDNGRLAIVQKTYDFGPLTGVFVVVPDNLMPPFLREEDKRGNVYRIPFRAGFNINQYLIDNQRMIVDSNYVCTVASFIPKNERNGRGVVICGPGARQQIAFTWSSPTIDKLFNDYCGRK